MRNRTIQKIENSIIVQQFDTFRTHLPTEEARKDDEREEMVMRIE